MSNCIHFLPQPSNLAHVMDGMDAMKLTPLLHCERAKAGMNHDNGLAAEPLRALINHAVHLGQT